jgi:NADP-dependent 3-hydroxy acid dehydrogenase YdfG
MKKAKVILISGVSSGFGNVTAKYLAQKGCWVFVKKEVSSYL